MDGQTLRYLYEYDKIILETNGAGNETAHNVYGTNLVSRTAAGETLYYMYNGHGDVTALLDNAGIIRAGYYYDAFGSVLEHTGTDSSITYAGYQYDKETGLYYLNSRMYDPGIARFLQEDAFRGSKSDPLSLNLYTYCANNPIIYCDLSGYSPVTVTWEGYVQTIDSSELSTYERSGWAVFKGNAYADKMYIDANATVDKIYVSSGTTTKIRNNGSVGRIETGDYSTTNIYNGTSGNINSIYTGSYSNTGIYSYTDINNVSPGIGSNGYIFNMAHKATNNVSSVSYWYSYGVEYSATGTPYTGPVYATVTMGENKEIILNGLKSIGKGIVNFFQGLGSAVLESLTLDTSSELEVYYSRDNETIYLVGKTVGSATMTVVGTISTIASGVGDVAVSWTGVGELVTLPATAYCAGVTTVSAVNTGKNVGNLINEIKSNGSSSGNGESNGNSNNWGNRDTLQDHFDRHGSDFGAKDPNDYAKKANDFYNDRSNHQVKVDENGVTRVYDPNTNTFGSYNSDGTTRTFYKPTGGQKYFDSQPGK